jgi:hypothetical protein
LVLEPDPDVCIEVPRIAPELRRKNSEILWKIGFENGVIISTFVVASQEIESASLRSGFYPQALEKGQRSKRAAIISPSPLQM